MAHKVVVPVLLSAISCTILKCFITKSNNCSVKILMQMQGSNWSCCAQTELRFKL